MTMGQRIAERRKMLGISQESLGERMGVSRQAISKWEADGAIPEIDKLIGLSKLFGVSVGWLLGTELEENREEAAPKQEAGLNEEQLKMVEQIVRRYQQTQPKQKRNPMPMLLCLCCAAVALIVSVASLDKANRQLPNYEYQLSDLTNSYSSIRSQLYQLSDRLDELTEGEKLLTEFGAEFSALPDWKTARATFRAVPGTYQAGDGAFLSLRQNGSEQYQVNCSWDGVEFTAEADVPYGAYDCYFVLCRADGSQVQQNVSEAFYGLPYELEPVCEPNVCELGWNLRAKMVSLDAFILWLEPPWIMVKGDDQNLAWTQVDLVMKQNGVEIERLDLRELCKNAMETAEQTTGFFDSSESVAPLPVPESEYQEDISMMLEYFGQYWITLTELNEGDRFELELEAALNNGYRFTRPVRTYVYGEQDGFSPN